jgi:hypothetical protein
VALQAYIAFGPVVRASGIPSQLPRPPQSRHRCVLADIRHSDVGRPSINQKIYRSSVQAQESLTFVVPFTPSTDTRLTPAFSTISQRATWSFTRFSPAGLPFKVRLTRSQFEYTFTSVAARTRGVKRRLAERPHQG